MAVTKIINSETKNYKPLLTDKLVLDDAPKSGSFNAITSDAVYKAISVDPGNVPAVAEGDNGKVLTASYSEGEGSFEWATPSGGSDIPEYSADDADKVLGVVVDSSGDTPVASLDWVDQPANELPAQLGTAGQVLTVNAGATGVEWATPSGGGGGSSSSAFDTTFNLVNDGVTWRLSKASTDYINLTGGAGVYAYRVVAEITDASNPTAIDDVYNVYVRVGNNESQDTKAIGLNSDIETYPEDPATISFKSSGILNISSAQHVRGQNVYVMIRPAKTGGTAVTSFTGGSVTMYLAKLSTLSGGWQPES